MSGRIDLSAAQEALAGGHFTRALRILKRPVRGLERPLAEFLAAEALRARGYFARAARGYQGLIQALKPLEDPVLYLDARLALCGVLHSLGRVAEARQVLGRAQADQRRLRLGGYQARLRIEGLMLERAAGNYAGVRAGLRREFGAAADPQTRGYLLWALAGALRFEGRLAESERTFRAALREYRAAGDSLGAAYAWSGLGGICRIRGKLGAAQGCYARALRAFLRTEDLFGTAYGHCGLANVLRQRGAWGPAERHYRLALRLYAALEDRPDLGYVEWGLAKVLEKTERLKEARAGFKRALRLFVSRGEKRGIALALLSLAQLEHALGRGAAAEKLFDRALAVSRGAGLKAHLEMFT